MTSDRSSGTSQPTTEPIATVTVDPQTGGTVITGPANAVMNMQRTVARYNLLGILVLAVFVFLCLGLPLVAQHALTYQAALPSWIVALGLAGFSTFRVKLPGVDIGAGQSPASQPASALEKLNAGLLVLILILVGVLVWHSLFAAAQH
jgi:hypothetical protein